MKTYCITYEIPAYATIEVEAETEEEAYTKADSLLNEANFEPSSEAAAEIVSVEEE